MLLNASSIHACATLLAVEALWRLSCDLLLVKEDLQLRSLCLCLHSRQFLTATQHTERDGEVEEKTGKCSVMESAFTFQEKTNRGCPEVMYVVTAACISIYLKHTYMHPYVTNQERFLFCDVIISLSYIRNYITIWCSRNVRSS